MHVNPFLVLPLRPRTIMSRNLLYSVVLIASTPVGAQEPGLDHTMFRMSIPAGFAVTADLAGLVVSQPDSAELVFFNTVTEKETKRAPMEFPPGALCLRDRMLFAAGKGSGVVRQLDLSKTKVVREFALPGDGISHLAVHPRRSLLFASTASFQVFILDWESGKIAETEAAGDHLAVSPDGEFLFTGMQPPVDDGKLVITETSDGNIRFLWDDWGARATIAKYRIAARGLGLELDSAQNNAAVNGYTMHLTPDGKRIAMPGGGGWRPPAGRGTGGGYVTAIFSADNLQTTLGQAIAADAIAFHPVLDLAATNQGGREIVILNGKSLKERQKIVVAPGAGGGTTLFAWVGKGTKVALYNGANPQNPLEGLHFFDVDLTDAERATLSRAYGKLPDPTQVAAAPKPDEPAPSLPTPAAPVRPQTPRAGGGKKAASSEAVAGFNDASGLNADRKKFSPYPVGAIGQTPGAGEPGWMGPWNVDAKITYQSDVIQEGDGAMFLQGTVNAVRKLAQPYQGKLIVEQFVRLPPGGDLKAYVGQNENSVGPMWAAGDGKFRVLEGSGQQFVDGHWVESPFACEPDQWYKVTLRIDVSKNTWEFSVDDEKFERDPIPFRTATSQIGEVRYLTEKPAGVYVDAIRVRAE